MAFASYEEWLKRGAHRGPFSFMDILLGFYPWYKYVRQKTLTYPESYLLRPAVREVWCRTERILGNIGCMEWPYYYRLIVTGQEFPVPFKVLWLG